jgi:hypothetical protein
MSELSDRILNLPCKVEIAGGQFMEGAYRLGHRDARHAAADLVLAAEAAKITSLPPDDLRRAAETIIGCVTKTRNEHGVQYERDRESSFGLLEPYELAAAYLAEHPADENEWITDDWLRSVGFEGDDLTIASDYSTLEVFVFDDGPKWWLNNQEFFPAPFTRGETRRLWRALGVQLHE